MICRICGGTVEELITLENMPDRAQELATSPSFAGIDLVLVQCLACGTVQLDNDPVSYWQTEYNSSWLSTDMPKDREKMLEGFRKIFGKEPDFILANRLEHHPDPVGYLRQMEGCGIVEVPNGRMILGKGMPEEICLDHLFYFDLHSIWFTLLLGGFEVSQIQSIRNGYVISANVSKRKRFNLSFWKREVKINKVVIDRFIGNQKTAFYGAGHAAFASLCLFDLKDRISYIVDDTPEKQGKFAPTTGIPIVPASRLIEDPVELVIICAGSYSKEISLRLDHPNPVILFRGKLVFEWKDDEVVYMVGVPDEGVTRKGVAWNNCLSEHHWENCMQSVRERTLPFLVGDNGVDLCCGIQKIKDDCWGIDTGEQFGDKTDADDFKDCSDLVGYEGGIYDWVFSSNGLEHIEDWKKALSEWVRVLKVGGAICLYLPWADKFPGWDMDDEKYKKNRHHKWNPSPVVVSEVLHSLGINVIECDDDVDDWGAFLIVGTKGVR